MIVSTIADVLSVLPNSRLVGPATSRRKTIGRISTDSRSLKKRDLFVALVGERFDGHDFVANSASVVAAALVNESWLARQKNPELSIPLIVVEDTLRAYGDIAAAHRSSFSIPVVAIAGSNGKTTTKELVADVLATRYDVLRTEGNLNNLIGVPATILRMTNKHTAAVIEIGTNTPGEIERLSEILQPTHGVITNIGAEHLELLGSLDGVADEEGALFRYLDASGGTPFVYLDDPYLSRIARKLRRLVTYGRTTRAHVRGRIGKLDANGAPSIEITDTRRASARTLAVQLSTPGLHTATNALAAAAIGLTLKVSPTRVKSVLESFTPRTYAAGYARLAVVRSPIGTTILNDTYNANPDSAIAAFATLRAMKPGRGGRRIVVLGEMKELGASSASEHARVGREIAKGGKIDRVMFFGDEMRHAHAAITATAGATVASTYYENKTQLAADLTSELTPEDIVLVKGSRGMKMEEVVAAILDSR
jgi:UDP-N-acetylmuramoyl-tripeptide--D-alanyl-D-alanine ligase